jgi:hypothetical protein
MLEVLVGWKSCYSMMIWTRKKSAQNALSIRNKDSQPGAYLAIHGVRNLELISQGSSEGGVGLTEAAEYADVAADVETEQDRGYGCIADECPRSVEV